jgi:hypothetical protein
MTVTIFNFRTKRISFDFGWYPMDVFSLVGLRLFEKIDPSYVVIIYFHIVYFQFSIIAERDEQ